MELNAGRPRVLPLVDVVTGPDGFFTTPEVNSIYPPSLSWFPPDQWLDGGIPVVGESGADIDVGVIQLTPATVIRVRVELVGGALLGSRHGEPMVGLQPKSENTLPVSAERVGTDLVLRGVSFSDGNWSANLYNGSKLEQYTAPFHLEPGDQKRNFTLRLLRDNLTPAEGYFLKGRMEVSGSSDFPTAAAPDVAMTGKVVGPDGSPVEGAIVSDFSIPIRRTRRQWMLTGPSGEFRLTYRAGECTPPSVSYGDSDYWNLFFSKPTLRELPCEQWLQSPQTIVMPAPSRLSIDVSGIDPSAVHASWWSDSFGWQAFSSLRPWISAWSFPMPRIRVVADGYLPMSHDLAFSYFDPAKGKPPAQLPIKFQFDNTVRRTLSVVAAGRPLSGVTVDVESIANLDSDQRVLLGTWRLPTDGHLELLGAGDQMVEAFVYASGFEPHREIWNTNVPLVIELKERSSTLEFAASSSAVIARIRNAESPGEVHTAMLSNDKPTHVRVAPGIYDITCYNARGETVGYERLAVANSGAADCSVDRRPRLTVSFPDDGWNLSVTESTPRGASTGWAVMLAVPGLPDFHGPAFTVVNESKTGTTVALSYAGRWHVEARLRNQSMSLWRDIDVQPGASISVAVPKETGTLKGSMRTYGGGLERSEHGFAGPRMQLIADHPNQWSVTEYIPPRDARQGEQKHHFTLAGIPAGDYHLYQHLIGESKNWIYGKLSEAYTSPIDAWGGIPVKLTAGATTQLRDFIEYPREDVHILVTDAKGNPVDHATVRIRDRMSESWRQIAENPFQLEQAAHPIPYPAAARLIGGQATLPRVREGWLDLFVELDSGAAFEFTATVSAKRRVTLTLPFTH